MGATAAFAIAAALSAGLTGQTGPTPAVDAPPKVDALTAPDDVRGLRAVFRVNAPPDVVLETLWDVHRFRTIFPDIHSLDVLAEKDADVDAKFTVDAVLATVSYTLRRHIDRGQRAITWKNIGGDLKTVRGGWSVRALDDGASEVTYTSFVDVGTFVPTGVVRDIAMSKVKEMAGRVRAASLQAARTASVKATSPTLASATAAAAAATAVSSEARDAAVRSGGDAGRHSAAGGDVPGPVAP